MTTNNKRDFDKDAATWDDNPQRVHLAGMVAEALFDAVPIDAGCSAVDYGAGTGLVTLALAPRVRSVCAADSARGMLAKLREKAVASGLRNVTTMQLDLETDPLPPERFDLVVSTMTLHHVENAVRTIAKLAAMLDPGGHLAIVDLDLDDGEFHADPTGVRHEGFDREFITQAFASAGLGEIEITTAASFEKEVAGKGIREFTLFLAVGRG